MAVFLDKQKPGLKNWSHLAAKLGVTRKTFKTFETSNTGNPTEEFFEIVKVKFPKLTVGELIGHLEAIQRRDVINAIQESDKGESDCFVTYLTNKSSLSLSRQGNWKYTVTCMNGAQ